MTGEVSAIMAAFASMARQRYRLLVKLTPGVTGAPCDIDVDAMSDDEILKLDAACSVELLRLSLR